MCKSRSIACLMALLTLSFAASGCASREPVGNDFCFVSGPIFIEKNDVLTDRTAQRILAHNELGVRLCDWPGADD